MGTYFVDKLFSPQMHEDGLMRDARESLEGFIKSMFPTAHQAAEASWGGMKIAAHPPRPGPGMTSTIFTWEMIWNDEPRSVEDEILGEIP